MIKIFDVTVNAKGRGAPQLRAFAKALQEWANAAVRAGGVEEAERQLAIGATAGLMKFGERDNCAPGYVRAAGRAVMALPRRRLLVLLLQLVEDVVEGTLDIIANLTRIRITIGAPTP